MKINANYDKTGFSALKISDNAFKIVAGERIDSFEIINYMKYRQENNRYDIFVHASRKNPGKLTAIIDNNKYRQHGKSAIKFLEKMCIKADKMQAETK